MPTSIPSHLTTNIDTLHQTNTFNTSYPPRSTGIANTGIGNVSNELVNTSLNSVSLESTEWNNDNDHQIVIMMMMIL